jgi:hypothetical protein
MSGDGNFWPRLEHQAMFTILKLYLNSDYLFVLTYAWQYACCVLDPRMFFYDDHDIGLGVKNIYGAILLWTMQYSSPTLQTFV